MIRNTATFELSIPFLPEYRKAWLVGGAVRDILLGKQPYDLDIIVSKNAAAYARKLAQKLNARAIELGKAPLCVHRIVSKKHTLDIVGLNGTSIEQDLLKRDFSINAMAWDIFDRNLIDLTNGRKDLEDGKVRMVSDSVFQSDPLRLLRAFRLSAVFGFHIERKTQTTIEEEAHLIKRTAAERIRAEWIKILASTDSAPTIRAMEKAKILRYVLPEFARLKKYGLGLNKSTDIFANTLSTLSSFETYLKSPGFFGQANAQLFEHCPIGGTPDLLKFALLMHDTGRPGFRLPVSADQNLCLAHGEKSARLADKVMRRMTYSNAQRRYVTFIVGHHYVPLAMFKENRYRNFPDQTTIKLFQKAREWTPDLLLHALSAVSGQIEGDGSKNESLDFKAFILRLLSYYHHYFKPSSRSVPILTGRDLITYFNLQPSPLFKTILDLVEEKRLMGQLKSKRDALKYIKSFLKESGPQHGS